MAPREKRAVRKVKMHRVESSDPLTIPILTKKGCFVPSKVLVKWHKRASLSPKLERSKIQEADLKRLRREYAILDKFTMIISGPDDRVVSPLGCVAFYKDAFEASIMFPLHSFIPNILNFYIVSLT